MNGLSHRSVTGSSGDLKFCRCPAAKTPRDIPVSNKTGFIDCGHKGIAHHKKPRGISECGVGKDFLKKNVFIEF